MYKFYLKNVEKAHQYEELIKVFLKPDEFLVILDEKDPNCSNVIDINDKLSAKIQGDKYFELSFDGDKNILKKELFNILASETNYHPKWGTITGIRPVKLFGETVASNTNKEKAIEDTEKLFQEYYCVSEEKTHLTSNIYKYQMDAFGEAEGKSVGLYIGIPFCPTRCLYCSFTSNQTTEDEISKYMKALHKEIDYVATKMKEMDIYAEYIYIGGGTPTTLDENALRDLLEHVNRCFKTDKLKEFTVEAGRPDTITEAKLLAIKEAGVERISINPQTMHDKTLELIGRAHSVEDVRKGFELAHKVGIKNINTDLIVGLPGENLEDFKYSLEEVIKLEPTNITIHTLAVKRASKLAGIDESYHYNIGKIATEMMDYGYERLEKENFIPYYLYRQKHMAGAGENTGFCLKGTESIYNARIMDEHQSIVALGAGGISKLYYPEQNRLERVANVSNYQIYIERIDEMLERKEKNLFKEV